MTTSLTAEKLLELTKSVGKFTEIICSDYLEPWQCYIIEAYEDPIFSYIKRPRTLIINKEMYDMAIRYIRWRIVWDKQLTRYILHKVRRHENH